MSLNKTILDSLEFIEDNLTVDLKLKDISDNAGYSIFYFSRLFKDEIGISVMDYIKNRRLLASIEDIIKGRKIIDIALDFGYETHSGFTKAFTKKFNYSPSLLRAVSMEIKYLGGSIYMKDIYLKNVENYLTEEALYNILIENIRENGLKYDLDKVDKAYKLASKTFKGEKRYSGEDYITHILNIAIILVDMNVGEDILLSGLLYQIVLRDDTLEMIEKEFSKSIVDIIVKVNNISEYDVIDEVMVIKIAERLHNMRTIEFLDKNRWNEKAKETLETFLPIAVKIDNRKLIEELNNLSLKYLNVTKM